MLFTRFFSLLFLCTIFGLVSAASVAPARKRFGTEAEAVSILQDLATEINGLLPQFGQFLERFFSQTLIDDLSISLAALQQAGNATDDDVIPLVNQLTSALGSAGTQLLNLANPFFVPRNIQDDSIDRRQSEFTTLWNEIVSVRIQHFLF